MSEMHFCTIPRKVAKYRGIKRYMTGVPCKRCHITSRWVSGFGCIACQDYYRTPKQKKEYLKSYYLKNREKLKNRSEQYRLNNKEKQDQWRKDWEARNPELAQNTKRAYKHRRRTIEQQGPSTKEINDWAISQEKVCEYCGCDCSESFHLDHYIPLSRGGKHELSNLRISCAYCNLSKGAKMPDEWLEIMRSRQ